jgi:fatty-acyl-CoA synthase
MDTPITDVEDIRRIESQDYAHWVGATSTFGLIGRAAANDAGRTALLYVRDARDFDSALRWSYGELVDAVRRAANLFRALGVGRGEPVAILAPNLPSTQIAFWGAQLAGCVLPINYLLNEEHIGALLRAAGVRVMVTLAPCDALLIHDTGMRAARLAGVRTVLAIDPDEDSPAADSFQQRLGSAPAQWPTAQEPRLDDLAALFHTGGTTGLPKLLRHTHRNELHTSRSAPAFYGLRAGDVMLNGFPLFHVAGAFVYGLSVLGAGGTLLLPTLTGMRNPEFVRRAWAWADRCGVTHLGCVPTILSALLAVPRGEGEASALRLALTGGSPLPNELASRFERAFGVPVRNIFGMTESAGLVAIEPAGGPRAPGCVGLRLPYSRVVAVPLADAQAGRVATPCGPGETGVIALRGPHVSDGYLDSSRDAGTFTGDGWLLSGDLGHVDADGRIFLTGRAKDLIIRGSHNIEPSVIEEAFLAHPAVSACAAVGEPDGYAGELPVVFVTLEPGARAEAAQLLAEAASRIPERPAVPKRVSIVEQMPLTAIGKIYKPVLRVIAARVKLEELLRGEGLDVEWRVHCAETSGGGVRADIGLATDDATTFDCVRRLVAGLPIDIEVARMA